MAVISGSTTKSGIVSLPSKVQRQRYDENNIIVPTIRRSGDHDYLGNFSSPFDDKNTLIFGNTNTVMGCSLPSGSQYIDSLVATPNTAPTLIEPSSIEVSSIDSNTWYITNTGENFKAFNDSRIYFDVGNENTSFYKTGTNETILPGFNSHLGSKFQIVIDLPNNSDLKLAKECSYYTGSAATNRSGFAYYNFDIGGWEEIGHIDPATGNGILFDYACEVPKYPGTSSKSWLLNSGTNNYPMQFRPPIAQYNSYTAVSASINGMQKIGVPTIANMAPFATKYHATSSQTFRLTNSISHPFLFEKAIFEAPFTAEHFYDDISQDATKAWFQDNYTFFIYRQQRFQNQSKIYDTSQDVSSSLRFIVASASMAIYNETARLIASDLSAFELTDFSPTNSPAQSVSFGVTDANVVAGGMTSAGLKAITGTLRLEMVAAVSPVQDLGFHILPNSSYPDPNRLFACVNHMWAGGTTCLPFFELASGFTGKEGISASYAVTASNTSFLNARTFEQLPENRNLGTFFGNVPIQAFDQRATNPLGGVNSSFTAGGSTTGTFSLSTSGENSVVSPYMFFPNDELVFGFDAGIGIPLIGASQKSAISSSFMTIKAGSGKLTLFGSLVSKGKEFFETTNQPLTTVSVIEALHYDATLHDQYQVEQYQVYTGSNQEQTVAGGYGILSWDEQFDAGVSGERRVISTRNKGTLGTTGSLQRFNRLISQDEMFKDTGLSNTSVFRHDKFGQIRDMLEPLNDGRFQVNKLSKQGLRQAPIFVKFFKDGKETSPLNTFSQNLSTYATSSITYIDNPESTLENPAIGQDRPTNPDVSLEEYVEID